MIRLMAWSARRSRMILILALLIAVAGGLARRSLPRDAITDVSDPQIVLYADWMGHPTVEVAARITGPLTSLLDGIPASTAVRGTSMPGMAYVDVVFASSSDLDNGRAEIVRRVAAQRARLPATARLQIGPLASSTGWVFQYALVDPARRMSPLELRRIQDEIRRPRAREPARRRGGGAARRSGATAVRGSEPRPVACARHGVQRPGAGDPRGERRASAAQPGTDPGHHLAARPTTK